MWLTLPLDIDTTELSQSIGLPERALQLFLTYLQSTAIDALRQSSKPLRSQGFLESTFCYDVADCSIDVTLEWLDQSLANVGRRIADTKALEILRSDNSTLEAEDQDRGLSLDDVTTSTLEFASPIGAAAYTSDMPNSLSPFNNLSNPAAFSFDGEWMQSTSDPALDNSAHNNFAFSSPNDIQDVNDALGLLNTSWYNAAPADSELKAFSRRT